MTLSARASGPNAGKPWRDRAAPCKSRCDARGRLDADAIPKSADHSSRCRLHSRAGIRATVPLRRPVDEAVLLVRPLISRSSTAVLLLSNPGSAVEIVSLRARHRSPAQASRHGGGPRDSGQPVGKRKIWLSRGRATVAAGVATMCSGCYDRGAGVIEEATPASFSSRRWVAARQKRSPRGEVAG